MLKKANLLLFMVAAASLMLNAEQVSEPQARALASQFFNTSLPVQAPAMKAKIKGKPGATPFYVYNNPEQAGWVIVAGDDRARSILAWGDDFYFDENDVPECVTDWLNGYAEQIANINTGVSETASMSSFAASNKLRIAPMLTSNMAQGLPFNQMCPEVGGKRCVTGCVATAMAQILYYYKSSYGSTTIPAYTTSTLKINNEALPATTFNYGIMNDWYDNEEDQSAGAMEVAKLLEYCGQSVQMDYNTNTSSAKSQLVAFTKYFGYDKNASFIARDDYNAAEWENIIYTELSNGRPVYISARKRSGGHAFICDGYDNGLYHINWGWRGHQNGYFALNALSDGNSGGTGAASGSEGYTLVVKAMIGLQPSTGTSSNTSNNTLELFKACTTPTATFTRSDNSQDFTGVNPIAYYYNFTTQEQTFDLGWGLYDSKGNFIKNFTISPNRVLLPLYYYYPNASMSLGKDLADGYYYLYPMCRESGTEQYNLCMRANVNYIQAQISGNTLTLLAISPQDLSDIKINSLSTSEIKRVGSPMTINLNVTNNGQMDYNYIYMWIDDKAVSATTTDIAINQTGNVLVNYIPKTAGTKNMKFTSDSEGKKVLYTTQINIESATETSITGTVSAQVSGTTLTTSATVTNTNTNAYNDYIVARLFKKEPNSGNTGYVCGSRSQLVNLQSGASATVNFTFENLEFPNTYFVIYFYYSKGKRVRIKATADQNTVSPFDKLDVNQDGSITAVDASAIYDVMLGNSYRFKPYADVNGDGHISAADVTAVYNKILGN